MRFELTLKCSLEDLWAFHQDVTRALPLLSPPGSDVRIISADLPARQGQVVQMNVRGPLGIRLGWRAKIVEFHPPALDPNTGHWQAAFTDVQERGPFAEWRHEHRFREVLPGQSQMTDEIAYRVGLGPLGWFANRLWVARQIRQMFAHRHAVTRDQLNRAQVTGLHSD